ncbi:hypothetical protein ILYODFUR_019654 [Ilyodon furcidens]|uniref:Uncharacterized protein n=1 Tax=Ilyodon furcidens TaxID=33524 RepID=A0ABV0T275_9TELE
MFLLYCAHSKEMFVRRQRGLNASLQLLHTSCSPHVFHSSLILAKRKTGAQAYSPTHVAEAGTKTTH